MLGAIAGDIIGSVYEWRNIKTVDFPLFDPRCTWTDDSMTGSIAEAFYGGVPEAITTFVMGNLDHRMQAVVEEFQASFGE